MKIDSWLLIHKSYGKDNVLKQVGTVKDYTSPSSGFNIGIAEEDEFYYIVYSAGGKTEYVTNPEELKKFIGKADDVQEAAVLAAADGYIIDEEFKDMAGNYSEDKSNYYLDLGKLTSRECPYQKKHYTLTVNKVSGTITEVKDNGAYIELYNKKCTNNPRLLKIEKKKNPKMTLKRNPQDRADNIYETERLILRPMSLEDADFILDLYNRPKFIQFIGDRNLKTVADAGDYIKNRFLPQFERLGYGNYLMITKEGNHKIGGVGIFEREGLDVVDIGFSLLDEFEGKGYAYEAALKIKSVGMNDFGLIKISAITTKDNFSSQKLIEKLGLRFRKYVTIPNDPEELMYYETE
uniref:GNAT family N-acetyltransferase n=3 Tax=Chryseobacterium TaxID=59732 RepID=A0AAU6WSH8_9FLAO